MVATWASTADNLTWGNTSAANGSLAVSSTTNAWTFSSTGLTLDGNFSWGKKINQGVKEKLNPKEQATLEELAERWSNDEEVCVAALKYLIFERSRIANNAEIYSEQVVRLREIVAYLFENLREESEILKNNISELLEQVDRLDEKLEMEVYS